MTIAIAAGSNAKVNGNTRPQPVRVGTYVDHRTANHTETAAHPSTTRNAIAEYSRAARRSAARPIHATTISRITTTTTTTRYHHAPRLMKPRLIPFRAASAALGAGRGAMRPGDEVHEPPGRVAAVRRREPPSLFAPERPPPEHEVADQPTADQEADEQPGRPQRGAALRREDHVPDREAADDHRPEEPADPVHLAEREQRDRDEREIDVAPMVEPELRQRAGDEDERVPAASGRYDASLPTYVVLTNRTTIETAAAERAAPNARANRYAPAPTATSVSMPHGLRGGHGLHATDGEQQRSPGGERRVVVEERQPGGPFG